MGIYSYPHTFYHYSFIFCFSFLQQISHDISETSITSLTKNKETIQQTNEKRTKPQKPKKKTSNIIKNQTQSTR